MAKSKTTEGKPEKSAADTVKAMYDAAMRGAGTTGLDSDAALERLKNEGGHNLKIAGEFKKRWDNLGPGETLTSLYVAMRDEAMGIEPVPPIPATPPGHE